MTDEQRDRDDLSFDTGEDAEAQLADTGVGDTISSPDTSGDPTVSDLTIGGTGTSIGNDEDLGGGGGMVDRIGRGTTGGVSSGTIGTVGSGMPPRPEDPDGDENTI